MSDAFLREMGERFAQRRKELHLTQEELSERIDLSSQTISCIELGKKAVRPENLAKLCSALDISADYILYGKRSEQQMNDTIAKLSALDREAYTTVRELIDLLHDRK